MGEHDRRWHQLRCFVTGVSEHDSLVAGSLFSGFFTVSFLGVNALGDVGRLRGEVIINKNLVGVENVIVVHVANSADRIANGFVDVDDFANWFFTDLGNGDFAPYHDNVTFYKGLAGNAAFWIDAETGIQDRIGNGIANFVRMAFANGLGGENITVRHGMNEMG